MSAPSLDPSDGQPDHSPGSGMPAYLFAAIGIIIVILAGALRMNARVGPMIRDAHRRRTATS